MSNSDIFIKLDDTVTESLVDPNEFFISYETIILSSEDNYYSETDSNLSDTIIFTCDEQTVKQTDNTLSFIDSDDNKQEIIDSDISDIAI